MNKRQLIAAGAMIFLLLSGCSRGIKHDPIEDNPKYQAIIKQAEEETRQNISYPKSRMVTVIFSGERRSAY